MHMDMDIHVHVMHMTCTCCRLACVLEYRVLLLRNHAMAAGPNAADEVRRCGKRWFQIAPGGTPPSARCSHTATRVGWNVFIIGGGSVEGQADEDGDDAAWVHYSDVPILNVRTSAMAGASNLHSSHRRAVRRRRAPRAWPQ